VVVERWGRGARPERANSSDDATAVVPAAAVAEPPAAPEPAVARTELPVEEVEVPAETRALEPPAPRPMVRLAGAAIRVEADGSERADLDGALTLFWRENGRSEKLALTVVAGGFSLEVPPTASLFVSALELGELSVEPEQRELGLPKDRFLVLRGRAMSGVRLHVRAAEDGREL